MEFIWKYPGKKDIKKEVRNYILKALEKPRKRYLILCGPTGNGKTSIVYNIAKELQLQVYRITSEHSYTKDQANMCSKQINLQQSLFDDKKHIVLIDDFDDFRLKKHFMKMPTYCNFPIIYIIHEKDYKYNNFYHNKHSTFLQISKPIPSEIVTLLETIRDKNNLPYDDKELYDIARYSPSVRKALLIVESGSTSKEYHPNTNITKQIQTRTLTTSINTFAFNSIFSNIRTYDSDHYKILKEIAYYDFLFSFDPWNTYANPHSNKNEINPLYINGINAPIESLKLTYKQKPKPTVTKKPKKEKPTPPAPEPEHVDITSLF